MGSDNEKMKPNGLPDMSPEEKSSSAAMVGVPASPASPASPVTASA